MSNKVLLTEQELTDIWIAKLKATAHQAESLAFMRETAKAQLKNVIEWGEEPCPHPHGGFPYYKKHECIACWNELSGFSGQLKKELE